MKMQQDEKMHFLRGKVAKVTAEGNGDVTLEAEDTLTGKIQQATVNMAVMATGMVPVTVAEKPAIDVETDDYGFLLQKDGAALIGVGTAVRPLEVSATVQDATGAEEEGVKIEYLVAPVEILTENGKAVGMKCRRMELGEPDESGRRRPVPIEGSKFNVDATNIIPAISQEPDFTGLENLREGKDWIKADENGLVSDKVYAGGDNLNLGLVVDALYHDRVAAAAIHGKFSGEMTSPFAKENVIRKDKILLAYYEPKPRNEKTEIPVDERFADPNKEISIGLTREQLIEEAKRCMSCGMCFECGQCWTYCQDSAIIKPLLLGQKYKFKLEFCKGCDKCAENCPCGYIEMHDPASYTPPQPVS